MKENNRGFGKRGWILIVVMFITNFASIAAFNSVNATAVLLQNEFSWSMTTIQTVVSISAFLSVITQFISGSLLVKASARKVALVSSIIFIATMIVQCVCRVPAIYLIAFVLMKIFMDVWMFMANSQLVNNWFPRKSGIVMGITTFGIPLGAGIGIAVSGIAVGIGGLSTSYVPFIILAAIAIALEMLFLKDYPEQMEEYPDNDPTVPKEQLEAQFEAQKKAVENSPWTVKRILTTKESWMFIVPCGLFLFGSAGVMTQISAILMEADYGFYEKYGMMVMTGISLLACLGSFICGLLDTKFGTKTTMMVSSIAMTITGVLMAMGSLSSVLIAIIFLCIYMSSGNICIMSGCTLLWGRDGFAKAFRVLQPIATLISSFGSVSIAAVASAAGGYSTSFIMIAAFGVISIILTLLLKVENVQNKVWK